MSDNPERFRQQPSPTAVFSLFTGRQNQFLTKRITLTDEGALEKAAPENAGSGQVETFKLRFHEFPAFLEIRPKNQCLIHGTVKNGLADTGSIDVTTTGNYHPDTINRTLEYFEHPDGPCLSMLDHDGGDFTPQKLIEIIG